MDSQSRRNPHEQLTQTRNRCKMPDEGQSKRKSQQRVDEEMRRANRANSKKQTKRERQAIRGGKRFRQMETKPRKNEKGGSAGNANDEA
jgi:hypothetical protein